MSTTPSSSTLGFNSEETEPRHHDETQINYSITIEEYSVPEGNHRLFQEK